MLVLHCVIKNEGFLLASELKFSKNMFWCPSVPPHVHTHAHPQGNETLCLTPLIYFWMNEKGWDDSTVHAKREEARAAALPLLSGWAIWTLLQHAGEQHWILPLLKWTRMCYLTPECPVRRARSILEVMNFEFLQPKLLQCSLAGVVRQRWAPPVQCLRCSPKRGTLDFWKMLQAASRLLKGSHLPLPWSCSTNWAPHPLSGSKVLVTLD